MHRMSVNLPVSLYQRLLIAADREGTSIATLLRELLDKALKAKEAAEIERIYEGLEQLKGIGSSSVTDASTTINETLYGENGAWRGHRE